MPQKKIPDLPAVVTLSLSDLFVVDNGVETKKATLQQIQDALIIGSAFAVKTADYTLTADDEIIFADASGGEFDLQLPAAADVPAGKNFRINKVDSSLTSPVNILRASSDTISPGLVAEILNTCGEEINLISDGISYWLKSKTVPSFFVGSPGPSSSPNNATVNKYFWKREGDSIRVRMGLTAAGSPNDWGGMDTAKVLPSGLSVDYNKLGSYAASTAQDSSPVGTYEIFDFSSSSKIGGIILFNEAVNGFVVGDNSLLITPATSDGYAIDVLVPVSGWN